MSTYSPHSPAFLAAIKRPVGVVRLLLRIALVLLFSPIRLAGFLLKWGGDLGERFIDWHSDWAHEVQVWTCPPVWNELRDMRERVERAEKDAADMRWVCQRHKADIERAQAMVQEQDWAKDPNLHGFPVIEWPKAVAAPSAEEGTK